MIEYVDRQALLNALFSLTRHEGNADMLDAFEYIIDKTPAADVAPVARGEWKLGSGNYPECSICGYMPQYDPRIDDIYLSPGCPFCLAHMDLKGEAHD